MDALFANGDILAAFKLMLAHLGERRVHWDWIIVLRCTGAGWEAGWVDNDNPINPVVRGYCQSALPDVAASGIFVRALRELKPPKTTMHILYLHCTDQSWVWVDNHVKPQLDAAGKMTKVDITVWN